MKMQGLAGAVRILFVIAGMAIAANTIGATAGITRLSPQDCAAMRDTNVISPGNPLACERLMRVRFSYVDLDGRQRQDGELIVMDALAPHVQRLLAQLRAAQFPLHSAHALTHYGGDDEASMADNNSSAFNGRPITGGGAWSKHAYGAAIDINPLQNPYISRAADGTSTVLPPASTDRFTERSRVRPGMAESVRGLFADNGFLIWGGNWRQPIDYQHFEIGDRAFIEQLARDTPEQAAQTFDRYVRTYRDCVKSSVNPVKPQSADAARRHQCASQAMQSVR
jgi:hypothetical protein